MPIEEKNYSKEGKYLSPIRSKVYVDCSVYLGYLTSKLD